MIFLLKTNIDNFFLINQQKQGGDHQENKISGRIQRDPLPRGGLRLKDIFAPLDFKNLY